MALRWKFGLKSRVGFLNLEGVVVNHSPYMKDPADRRTYSEYACCPHSAAGSMLQCRVMGCWNLVGDDRYR